MRANQVITAPRRWTPDGIVHRWKRNALLILLIAHAALAAEPPARNPLPEGTVLESVDGRLLHDDANDTWLFVLSEDVNTVNVRAAGGTRFPLLPGGTLEMLIADANDRYTPDYRLSARVTEYRGNNFLLAHYYLPLSRFSADVQGPAQGGDEAAVPSPDEQLDDSHVTLPDSDLAIPEEIVEKLSARGSVRGPQRPAEQPDPASVRRAAGRMLVERVGTIGVDPNGPAFVPDAFGWNLGKTRYKLLPCRVLEQTLRRQAAIPERIRFNVAGLVTTFRGKEYLLLQRAIPVYNYCNFGR
jgi:hypothetical protein